VSFRDENIRYLRPLWIRMAVIYLALITMISGLIIMTAEAVWGGLVGLGIVFFTLFYVRLRRLTLGRQALRSASPDAAARALFGPIAGRLRDNARAFLVTGTANIHVVYGGRERAEELLRSIDWTNQPPLLRGDYAAGLAKAREVPLLMDVPKLAPGAKTLRRSGALLIDIGLALAEHDVAAIHRLREAPSFKRHIVLRAVAGWALWKINDRDAEHWLAVSRELMPHAYGLGAERPMPMTPPPVDAANPYAAPSTVASADTPYDPTAKPKRSWVRVGLLVLWAILMAACLLILLLDRHHVQTRH
jgi:hypothetical protein